MKWQFAAGLTIAIALAGCVGDDIAAEGDGIVLTARAIDLIAERPDDKTVGPLRFIAGFELNSPDKRFGGLSGLSIGTDGTLTTVSDKGDWLTARLRLDDKGRLLGLSGGHMGRLAAEDGAPLPDTAEWRDAEAIESDGRGGFFVSFERVHRVMHYANLTLPPTLFIDQAPIAGDPANEGPEAIAVLSDGRLLIVMEGRRNDTGDLVGWIKDRNGLAALSYAPTGLFKPTDFAVLPSGDVLVLERRYTRIGGAAARLSVIDDRTIRAGARLETREIARLEAPLTVDNYEGLAVLPAPGGGWHLLILSDDNFNPLQRNLILQFHWPG
jgi:hypothetical protein